MGTTSNDRQNQQAITLEKPAPAPRADHDAVTGNLVSNALVQICEQEIASLGLEWPTVGQLKTPPKSLLNNLVEYCNSLDERDCRNYDKPTKLIHGFFKDMRKAIKSLIQQEQSDSPLNEHDRHLANKAKVFLKRLAHDQDFNQSRGGARRFRKYVKATKKQQALNQKLCAPASIDLAHGWHADRITTQRQLKSVGKSLDLCVGKLDSTSKYYFQSLAKETSSFWVIRRGNKLNSLLQLDLSERLGEARDDGDSIAIEEWHPLDRVRTGMPSNSLRNLVTKLNLDLDSCELESLGLYSAFQSGCKDRDNPDTSVTLGEHQYDLWFLEDEFILSKRPYDHSPNSPDREWGLLKKKTQDNEHDDEPWDDHDEVEDELAKSIDDSETKWETDKGDLLLDTTEFTNVLAKALLTQTNH